MHEQYRTKLAGGAPVGNLGAAAADGVMKDPVVAEVGRLAKLLRAIADKGINLRTVGGRAIETGGVLVLAVSDEDGEGDAGLLEEVLTEFGLTWEIYIPERRDLVDGPGQLADFVEVIAKSGRLVDSVVIGTPYGKDGPHPLDHPGEGSHIPGSIPVHVSTISVRGAHD